MARKQIDFYWVSDFYKARDVIDKFDPVLKSYKFVRRHVECTPINQYDQFLSQFMDVCLTLSMKKKTKIK